MEKEEQIPNLQDITDTMQGLMAAWTELDDNQKKITKRLKMRAIRTIGEAQAAFEKGGFTAAEMVHMLRAAECSLDIFRTVMIALGKEDHEIFDLSEKTHSKIRGLLDHVSAIDGQEADDIKKKLHTAVMAVEQARSKGLTYLPSALEELQAAIYEATRFTKEHPIEFVEKERPRFSKR